MPRKGETVEKQINLYRHELKYFIHKRQADELRLFLRDNMRIDPNSDERGSYWIRSLYFDTIDNRDYYDKMIGCDIRKKIRLRVYDISSDIVKLEIKNKYNNCMQKETANISRRDAIKLIEGDCNSLLAYNGITTNKIFAFMHQNYYRPIIIIDYEREAYLYGFHNIRVTLDKNLRAATNTNDIFNKDFSMIPVLNNDVYILEIKYDHMIPVFLLRVLSSFTAIKSQISKYCLGRNILGR